MPPAGERANRGGKERDLIQAPELGKNTGFHELRPARLATSKKSMQDLGVNRRKVSQRRVGRRGIAKSHKKRRNALTDVYVKKKGLAGGKI